MTLDHSPDELFFGDLLRTFRKQRGLTQQQLAQCIGASREAVSFWERGEYKPNTLAILHELGRVLRLSETEKRLLFEAHLGTAAILPLHNLPAPNQYFTGREAQLQQLHEQFVASQPLGSIQAISGLAGVGKTQLALTYAYRYREHYHDISWVSAETRETLVTSYVQLARLLRLPERQEQEQEKVVEAVKGWLREHKGWLLILDNVEELGLLHSFLPHPRQGAVLLTTRLQVTEPVAQSLPLECLSREEGAWLLLRRAKRLGLEEPLGAATKEEQRRAGDIAVLLGGLPLALDQAGAYVLETRCSLEEYLRLYESRRVELLGRRGRVPSEHPDSVVTTFGLVVERAERENSAAVDLLRLCAFLSPDAIPEALITNGAAQLGEMLQMVVEDAWAFNEAVETLQSLSLIQRHVESKRLSLHRLVQAVLKDAMSKEAREVWMMRCTRLLHQSFPAGSNLDAEQREWCEQLVPHVLLNADLSARQEMALPEAASLWHNAAAYLRDGGQYRQAESLFLRALRLREHLLGLTHPDVAHTLHGLAMLFFIQGKYTEAEPLYLRALDIFEALDPMHPDLARPLYGLGILYWQQGKFAEAEPLFQRSLSLFEQVLDPAHPDITRPLIGLAALYKLQGKYVESEPLYLRALHILEQTLGPQHSLVAYPLNNLAELYREQGQYDQAEMLFQRALHIWEQTQGPEHMLVAHALSNLAELYYEQGQYEQAEPLAQSALKIREQALKPEHPDIAYSLNILALLYYEQGQYEQADAFAQRALKIREQALEPGHPDTAISLNTLAMIYLKQGKHAEAEPLLRRALQIQERVLGATHPKLLALLEDYAHLLTHLHRDEEAAELEARAKIIRTRC
jgi:tetratricopeptide (TPR) repeat protein/transcriptional regulator with XRE-family HTH domain